MWANATLRRALGNSLTIAFSAAVLATCLAIFAARASTRYRFPGKGGALGLIMMPLILPEIIVGLSLLVVLLAVGVRLSILTIIIGHTLICMPYAVAILTTAFSSLDRSLEEAAYDLGETKWSAFRLVILPLVMPGIVSAAMRWNPRSMKSEACMMRSADSASAMSPMPSPKVVIVSSPPKTAW